jgi:hypothetical protein
MVVWDVSCTPRQGGAPCAGTRGMGPTNDGDLRTQGGGGQGEGEGGWVLRVLCKIRCPLIGHVLSLATVEHCAEEGAGRESGKDKSKNGAGDATGDGSRGGQLLLLGSQV